STPLGYMISEEVFQGLPDDIQEALIKAGEETMLSIANAMQDAEEFYSNEWEKEGYMEIYNLTEEEQEIWRNSLDGFEEEWAEEAENDGAPSFEALKLYKEALEKYK